MKKTLEWTTKTRPQQPILLKIGRVVCIFLLLGCLRGSHQDEFDLAQSYRAQEKFSEALALYEKVFVHSSDKKLVYLSAEAAADISENKTKNYKKAIKYLNIVIANAPDFRVAFAALEKKAFIEHKLLYYFEDAIQSYQRLLSYSDIPPEQSVEIRMNIVKSYFAIHKHEAAKNELVPLLSPTQPPMTQFKALILLGLIEQTDGHLNAAIENYQKALLINVKEKQKEEAYVSLALCFEQKEDYNQALEMIKKIENPDDFLKVKLKQLEKLTQFQVRRLNK